jgi:hypothetical protein
MKSFTLIELKKELQLLPASDLADLCVALAKYKKDNKDFLGYLLVDSYDKPGFTNDIKKEIDAHFAALESQSNLYFIKKSLRKLLRTITRYCKYMNDKAITCDLHIYFCQKIKAAGIPLRKSQLLVNLYEQQLKKISKLIAALHEDLQSDYLRELEAIQLS